MIKRIFYLTMFMFSACISISGQDTNIDSLENLLSKSEGKAKIDLYHTVASELYRVNASKAIDFTEQAITYAKNTNENNLIGTAYKNQGVIYSNLADDKKADESFQQALSRFEESGNEKETGSVLNFLAQTKNYLNEPERAIEYSLKSIILSQEIHDLRIEGAAYYNLGNSYYNQNNFDKALESHLKSLELRQKLGDKALIASSLLRLGIMAYSKQDFKLAEEYYLQVLDIRR